MMETPTSVVGQTKTRQTIKVHPRQRECIREAQPLLIDDDSLLCALGFMMKPSRCESDCCHCSFYLWLSHAFGLAIGFDSPLLGCFYNNPSFPVRRRQAVWYGLPTGVLATVAAVPDCHSMHQGTVLQACSDTTGVLSLAPPIAM